MSKSEFSLFDLLSILLQQSRIVVGFAAAGFLLAAVYGTLIPSRWRSTAEFVVRESDNGTSGLRSLAGQFGFSIPGTNSSSSPEFFRDLAKSGAVLSRVIRDSVSTRDSFGGRQSVLDVLVEEPGPVEIRELAAIGKVRELMTLEVDARTGVIGVSVATPWADVSHAIASGVLREVDGFTIASRRGQATAEAEFIQTRIDATRAELLRAEGALAAFLRENREYRNAPDLAFQHDRLLREVSLRQQVLVSLSQSFEDARIRAQRDVSTISVIEPPSIPLLPEPRGRIVKAAAGTALGLVIGVLYVLAVAGLRGLRASGREDFALLAAEWRRQWSR